MCCRALRSRDGFPTLHRSPNPCPLMTLQQKRPTTHAASRPHAGSSFYELSSLPIHSPSTALRLTRHVQVQRAHRRRDCRRPFSARVLNHSICKQASSKQAAGCLLRVRNNRVLPPWRSVQPEPPDLSIRAALSGFARCGEWHTYSASVVVTISHQTVSPAGVPAAIPAPERAPSTVMAVRSIPDTLPLLSSSYRFGSR